MIDREALHKKLDRVAAGEKVSSVSQKPEDVPNDLSFMVGIRRRLKLEGNGPRGLALVGTKAYVAEYFTDSLGVIDVNPEVRPKAVSLPLYPKKLKMTQVRTGEMFFHDAALCFQHWQSCSSCHPDARTDGLNWDLLNDGMGNPKQTKSMLLAHKTPPSMMSGIREKAEVAVRSGIKFIQFAVRPEEDAVAIDEYLKSLRPVPSPKLVKGKLSDEAKRGKKVFEKVGCAHCHYGAVQTDLKQYDVGTAKGLDAGKEYDTPTLVEVWRTAPYLVDGSAATMADVITKCNPNDKHGKTSTLTPQEVSDLVEFVLSQ
ncbi:MAG: c-type cytochrome [Planctomycetes bacterium]|nr:c-type cytochrome [Planctomycetota bacterium]